ncbi:hypothetical protein BDZ45DRAFT_745496 [Acephala macrosclerotiorum]|nr:hypothetical protein BDZ45DRAFT_745496 [Acephala macrosclerotiorum]
MVFQGMTFSNVDIGVDATAGRAGNVGSVALIDSVAQNVQTMVLTKSQVTANSTTGDDSIAANTSSVENTVVASGNTILKGGVKGMWVYGNTYLKDGPTTGVHDAEATYQTLRPLLLLNGFPVYGDGQTDDTYNIDVTLTRNAGCTITFFPTGTCEALSAISAVGSKFSNTNAPYIIVQVGLLGQVGVAQISDMLFTVADVLSGCILLQVNISGFSQGDIGIWDTPSSSAHIEDMLGWTADHGLGCDYNQLTSTGRGALIQSTCGTRLMGTAFEHNTLYQYNLISAENVFIGMQQSETPYLQGTGGPAQAPAPWTPNASFFDPTFSNCGIDDPNCRVA